MKIKTNLQKRRQRELRQIKIVVENIMIRNNVDVSHINAIKKFKKKAGIKAHILKNKKLKQIKEQFPISWLTLTPQEVIEEPKKAVPIKQIIEKSGRKKKPPTTKGSFFDTDKKRISLILTPMGNKR
jgi:hypothetical protein